MTREKTSAISAGGGQSAPLESLVSPVVQIKVTRDVAKPTSCYLEPHDMGVLEVFRLNMDEQSSALVVLPTLLEASWCCLIARVKESDPRNGCHWLAHRSGHDVVFLDRKFTQVECASPRRFQSTMGESLTHESMGSQKERLSRTTPCYSR